MRTQASRSTSFLPTRGRSRSALLLFGLLWFFSGCEGAPDAAPVVSNPPVAAPELVVRGLAAAPLPHGRLDLGSAPAELQTAFLVARQAEATHDPRFALKRVGDTLLATASAHAPGIVFDPSGVALDAGELGLHVAGYRCADVSRARLAPMPDVAVTRPNRALYRHGGAERVFDEWYAAGPAGLEQGLTIDDAGCTGDLQVRVVLTGLRAEASGSDGLELHLVPDAGGPGYRYLGLAAQDSAGRSLPARMAPSAEGLLLTVDTRGARGAIEIDPLLVPDTLGLPRPDEAPGDGAAGDSFGVAVAISADTALVGAEKDGVGLNAGQGSVYVFVRANGLWSLEGKLVASDGAANDNFGHAVAISGDTAVVGANLDDNGATVDQGSAYLFVRANGVWTQQQKTVGAVGANDQYGNAVAIDGDTAVVGSAADDVGVNANQGSAYVYLRTNGVWAQQAQLTASDGTANDNFGVSVGVSANTVVVGANLDDTAAKTDHGSAYIYTRAGVAWAQTTKLVAADSATGDNFGAQVAIDGDTVAVAATLDDVGVKTDEGTLYVYTRAANVWSLQQEFNALDLIVSLEVGTTLSLRGDTLIVTCASALEYVFLRTNGVWSQEQRLLAPANSAAVFGDTAILGFPSENVDGNFTQGSIYFFNRVNGVWSMDVNLTSGDGDQADLMGNGVSISGTTAVVGVPGDHVAQNPGRGSVYVFTLSNGAWAQEARLVAADGTNDDAFGQSVSLSGDTLAVGASLDDVALADQGSVYIFTRANGVWTQAQKLLAGTPAATDQFGASVSLNVDTLVVGVPNDDVGVNANQGSAYVFFRTNGAFAQQGFLTAGDGAASDALGRTVSVSGDTAVAGAPLDDVGVNADQGSAYVFLRTNGAWAQQAKLTSATGSALDTFGTSVAVSGNTVLVGAPQDDVAANADQGSVTVFVRANAVWTPQTVLSAADGGAGDQFGAAVAVDGDNMVVGAYLDAVGAVASAGSAYAIVRTGSTFCLQTRFVARNAVGGARFGSAVAVSGAAVAVGAPRKSGPIPYGNPNEGEAYTYAIDRNLQPDGQACGCAGECASGFCTDGVCCNAACDGGACDTCNSAAALGHCQLLGAGTVCRAATDVCDTAEACDGSNAACPNDTVVVQGTECRAPTDVCDTAEACDGVAKACPVDAVKPNTVECRAPTDVCDAAENCNGVAKTCPADRAKAANTECRAASDTCDLAEVCNGTLKTCPADAVKAAATSCRAAVGSCDVAETCDGAAKACPADGLKANGVVCRASTGVCDLAEACDGALKTCPADIVEPAGFECRAAVAPCDAAEACDGLNKSCGSDLYKVAGSVCRAATDLCDAAETCTGLVTTCPADKVKVAATICRAASDVCDVQEACDGAAKTCPNDVVKAVGVQCRAAADVCDLAEACDGAAKACPTDAFKPVGTECRASGGLCDIGEVCDGHAACPPDVLVAFGTDCRPAAGPCDIGEACDGVVKSCPQDSMRPANTECRSATDLCDLAEVCDGRVAACPADTVKVAGTSCRAASDLCDVAEACDGAAKACPNDAVKVAGVACRAASDVCDVAEACNGTLKTCPVDAVKARGLECRAALGVCDVAESCDGAAKACPGDAAAPAGTACRAATDVCDRAESCDGAARTCPADAVAPAGTACRPASDLCDRAEACNGAVKACPADTVSLAGTACRAAAGPCDAAESCDGAVKACPVDALAPAGTICAPPSCANGMATPAGTCVGDAATCPPRGAVSCDLYTCGPNACLDQCTEDAQCASSAYCDAGVCTPLLAGGADCLNPRACESGLCVDGVCCDRACGGQCEACNDPNSLGVCTPVVGDPQGGRPACSTDGSECAGTCDGILGDTCSYPAQDVSCRAPTCANDTATLAAVCSGDGTCPAPQTQACAPFICGATACLGDCQIDADCANGLFCSAGVCGLKHHDGDACGAAEQCISNHCVDGFCCDAACGGACEACDVQGRLGACVAVPSGAPHGGRTPCAGADVCAGECGGQDRNACVYPGADVQCLPATCENGVASAAADCDGAGACAPAAGSSCGAYACAPGGCLDHCADSGDCAVGYFCNGGVCESARGLGESCARSSECGSNFCVDGVCCNQACGGQCEACDTVGTLGTCTPVAGVPHGGRSACAGAGADCGGSCDGHARNTCVFAGGETICRQPGCLNGVAIVVTHCDGAGTCPDAQRVTCAPFSCGPIGCLGDCAANIDCAADRYCAAGVCIPKLGPGAPCATGGQCAQGFCTDGVCCNSRCTGQCEACDVGGHEGTCSVVTAQRPHAGRRACAGVGVCQGVCVGDRRDACGYPSADVVCHAGACVGGVSTPESACDGAGVCGQGAPSNCGAYACGPSGCVIACVSPADCAAGFVCDANRCVPPALPDAGTPDAAPPPADAGPLVDGLPPLDAFLPPPDSMVLRPDGSLPPVDAFMPPPDGVVVTPDGALPPADAFVLRPDGKPPLTDAQPPVDGPVVADATPPPADGMTSPPDARPIADAVAPRTDRGLVSDGGTPDAEFAAEEGYLDGSKSGGLGIARGSGCQCRTTGGGPGMVFLPILALALRRRRRR